MFYISRIYSFNDKCENKRCGFRPAAFSFFTEKTAFLLDENMI